MSSISQVNADVLQQAQQRIQQDLLTALAAFSIPEPLKSAVHHAVMLGGKRVRPALCYAAASLQSNHNFAAARRAAVAVELIHCYSLAHDDLPCMDNDLLRRGQPTCHVAFGENTALLAGDILQSMAFEILGSHLFDEQGQGTDAAVVLKQMQILATASSRMVSGQVLDLQAEGKQVDQTELENIGKDEQVQKSTYPALMGLQQAQAYAQNLHDQAFEALAYFGDDAKELVEISQFLLARKS